MFDESFATAWKQRYGSLPSQEFEQLAMPLTHRSIRDFDDRPVDEELISALVATAQSAATSSNLQLYSLISIAKGPRREQLAKLCGGQTQVANAPWFFAFLVDTNRLSEAARLHGINADAVDHQETLIMASVDAALAAERMLGAAQRMGLGGCYIGGLRNDPEGVKQVLRLPHGVFGVFGLTLGYPRPSDSSAIKPRLSQDAVWFREEYPEKLDIGEYDQRMEAFYGAQRYGEGKPWSYRSALRLSRAGIGSRQTLGTWLKEQGLGVQ